MSKLGVSKAAGCPGTIQDGTSHCTFVQGQKYFLVPLTLCPGTESIPKGSFKNYVDKMRWVGGQKMLLFVHVKGKKCPRRGR